MNAPGVIKLLSLADLGGLVDLAEGEGLSFDLLEINMEKDKKLLKLNEILALGPSMSVLIEGYQDNTGLTSLKGTLVPAKTLNKMISKIPVIGNIVIPKSDWSESDYGCYTLIVSVDDGSSVTDHQSHYIYDQSESSEESWTNVNEC